MKNLLFLSCLIILLGLTFFHLSPAVAAAQAVDEDKLFSGETTVEDQSEVVSEEADQELQARRIGFSGECLIQSTFTDYTAAPDWLGRVDDDGFQNLISTDLFLDCRFQKGVKSFLSAGFIFYPDTQFARSANSFAADEADRLEAKLKEIFVDANWKSKVYCRVGKQVVKWGPSYFWNPTDLINIEKKNFFDLDNNREGTTGIKIHIPTGVKRNIYFFGGLEDLETLSDVPVAVKYEWLVKQSEMSISAWTKGHQQPVFGYDISTWIGKLNCWGEICLADGDDIMTFDEDLHQVPYHDWYSKVSIGFNRKFNWGNYNDRISLTGELFYNQAGYDDNFYQKIAAQTGVERRKELSNQYLNEYQAYQNSRFYLAVFGTVYKFLIPELTLNVNGINNLVDHSLVLNAGLRYKPTLKELYFNFDINTFLGDSASEARWLGRKYQLQLGVEVSF